MNVQGSIRKKYLLLFLFASLAISGCRGYGRRTENRKNPVLNGNYQNDSSLQSGDLINFGSYEQDNDFANGRELIEWIILSVEKDRALLISRYALDTKPYNDEYNNVTWRTSTLRKWLNNDFFNEAFTAEEKDFIAEIENKNPKNPSSGTRGGMSTKDKNISAEY